MWNSLSKMLSQYWLNISEVWTIPYGLYQGSVTGRVTKPGNFRPGEKFNFDPEPGPDPELGPGWTVWICLKCFISLGWNTYFQRFFLEYEINRIKSDISYGTFKEIYIWMRSNLSILSIFGLIRLLSAGVRD